MVILLPHICYLRIKALKSQEKKIKSSIFPLIQSTFEAFNKHDGDDLDENE